MTAFVYTQSIKLPHRECLMTMLFWMMSYKKEKKRVSFRILGELLMEKFIMCNNDDVEKTRRGKMFEVHV
jgi:hypothetical protein